MAIREWGLYSVSGAESVKASGKERIHVQLPLGMMHLPLICHTDWCGEKGESQETQLGGCSSTRTKRSKAEAIGSKKDDYETLE